MRRSYNSELSSVAPHFKSIDIAVLAECVQPRLRVDLDRRNAFIQSVHISTCKQHAYCLFSDAKCRLYSSEAICAAIESPDSQT